jgi:hypothetical protein
MNPTVEHGARELPMADEISLEGVLGPDAEPPRVADDVEDVHDASTTVAELPAGLLDALKSPALRTPTASPPAIAASELEVHEDRDALLDLVDGLDADEPETLQLETVLLGVPLEPPEPTDVEASPRSIEIHVSTSTGALDAVESEIEQLPRTWKIAGALVAAFAVAIVAAALVRLVTS